MFLEQDINSGKYYQENMVLADQPVIGDFSWGFNLTFSKRCGLDC